MEPENENNPLSKIAAAIFIISALIAALFWVANVSATASHADQTANSAISELKNKAEKDDVQEMKKDLREIRDFLMNGKRDK